MGRRKCYNYKAELTYENIDPEQELKPIVFGDPTVTPWEDAEGGSVSFD